MWKVATYFRHNFNTTVYTTGVSGIYTPGTAAGAVVVGISSPSGRRGVRITLLITNHIYYSIPGRHYVCTEDGGRC